jgi:polyphosphate kinase
MIVAPFTARQHILQMIEREIVHAKAGRPSGIKAKINALSDPEIIRALYRASQAAVPIQLIVRGICCLRPKVPGISDTIRVHAIVDRFLEHARIFWWANGGSDEVYLSSADWMPRNLDRRIEVLFPVLDPALKKRIVEEILPIELADNTFAWELESTGAYKPQKRHDGSLAVRAQLAFIEGHRERTTGPRTAIRPEVTGATTIPPVLSSPPILSPAIRAAKAQSRRRRPDR